VSKDMATLGAIAPTVQPAQSIGHVLVKLSLEFLFAQAGVPTPCAALPSKTTASPSSICKLECQVHSGMVVDPHEQLETKLSISLQKCLQQQTFPLLDHCWPSVLTDHMLALLPEDALPNCLSCLFLRLLPAEMKDQLATKDLLTAKAMVASTNRIFFNAWPRVSVKFSAISATGWSLSSSATWRRSPPHHQGRRQQTHGHTTLPIIVMAEETSSVSIMPTSVVRPRSAVSPPVGWEMGQ
jgi:hypothetical protein